MLEIGDTLKQLRQKKQFTQKEVADLLHVTPQTISKWECNKSYPDLDYLVKLSERFNVTTDTLLGTAKPAFLSRLFSKRKRGVLPMIEEPTSSKAHAKQVYIFSISSWISEGEWQTQRLQMKLQREFAHDSIGYDVHMYSASKIETLAPQADIILLTPEYHFAIEQLKKEFPTIPVIAIDSKTYGLLQTPELAASIRTVLSNE